MVKDQGVFFSARLCTNVELCVHCWNITLQLHYIRTPWTTLSRCR